jgi:uncharacterized membrane protein YphA (DoxX/SURF4 family)
MPPSATPGFLTSPRISGEYRMFVRKASHLRRWLDAIIADDARLLDLAVRVAVIAFLTDDILEFRSYARELRIFLPSPLIPFVAAAPGWSDWLVSALHAAGLAALLWRPRLWPAATLVLALTAWRVVGDVLRLQPFVMMYAFTVLMVALPRASPQMRLQALRLMIVGVYFWAGFNKLNIGFYLNDLPWFIYPLWPYPPGHPVFNAIAFLLSLTVPVFEALIGILLIFRRTRKLATFMAFVMLAVVLFCLGPFGHVWAITVWPWNIYIFLSEAALFLAPHPPCTQVLRKPDALPWTAALIFIIAPLFGIWHLWPAAPSFKLYSGNAESGMVIFDAREDIAHLPAELRGGMDIDAQAMRDQPGGEPPPALPGNMVNVAAWLGAAHISLFPSEYVLRTGSRGLCPYLQYTATAVLRIKHPAEFDSREASYTTEPLCPR